MRSTIAELALLRCCNRDVGYRGELRKIFLRDRISLRPAAPRKTHWPYRSLLLRLIRKLAFGAVLYDVSSIELARRDLYVLQRAFTDIPVSERRRLIFGIGVVEPPSIPRPSLRRRILEDEDGESARERYVSRVDVTSGSEPADSIISPSSASKVPFETEHVTEIVLNPTVMRFNCLKPTTESAKIEVDLVREDGKTNKDINVLHVAKLMACGSHEAPH